MSNYRHATRESHACNSLLKLISSQLAPSVCPKPGLMAFVVSGENH